MKNSAVFKKRCGVILAVTTLLAGCFHDGGGSNNATTPPPEDAPPTTTVTGTVTAPGGSLAFHQPTVLEKVFAAVFGNSAVAALSGTSAVSGATVNLIEIDNSGTQVGAALASATTNTDGSFTVAAPATFTPSAKYVLRVGTGVAQMDTMVTDTTSQDIDPATKAATDLILSTLGGSGSLAGLNVAQVAGVQDTVAKLANDVTPGALIGDIVTTLKTETQNQEEANNILTSVAADGTLTGTVTNSSGTPLANIDIVVRDFSDWVTRAHTKTNAAGQYTAKVPSGSTKSYIVGALNHTATSTDASEWWTAGGGVANQFSAEKISVATTTAVTKDFVLDAGAQIKGVVYATDATTALGGIRILVRDFSNDMPVAFARTRPDGKYLINVRPGTYTVGTRNQTFQAYAGVTYNGPAAGSATAVTGGATATAATPIIVTAGNMITAKFALPAGGKVSGVVTDPTAGAITGMPVRFYGNNAVDDATYGAFVEGTRTNKDGGYRMWLLPGDYTVRARGQSATFTAATSTPVTQSFTSAVGTATATVTTDGTTPLSQVKVQVYDSTSATYQGFEASNGDGTVTVYSSDSLNCLLEFKVDSGSTSVGSAVYDGPTTDVDAALSYAVAGTRLTSGTAVPFTLGVNNPLGTITLPAGGELKGFVTKNVSSVSTAVGNAKVQVRTSGANGGFRFITTRTQSDGSYSISLPANTYNTVCAFVETATNPCNTTGTSPTGYYGSAASIAVTAGTSNTLATIDMIDHP